MEDRCPRGHRRTEWLDEEGRQKWPPPFEPANWLCPACQLTGEHEDEEKKKRDKNDAGHGLYVVLKPTTNG